MNSGLNTSPLKRYALVFKIYIWVKRIIMIALRVALLAAIALIILTLLRKGESNMSYSGGGSVSLNGPFTFIVIYYFVRFIAMIMVMSGAMKEFATINNFSQIQSIGNYKDPNSPFAKMTVPSFKGKPLRISLFPVIGEYSGWRFGFFTRQYKEGGVLRWRERKMDTILWVDLPKAVPHIIVDNRLNEWARRSNLSHHYDKNQLLHFEGNTGDKYNVYTPGNNQVPALQLFTPDVLQVFYERLPKVDIEVKNKTLWFVWRYGILDDKLAAEMFNGVAAFMSEFGNQLEAANFSEAELNSELITV